MSSLDRFAHEQLARIRDRGQWRTLIDTERHESAWVVRNGRRLLSFCCNDYLNLSQNPSVRDAAIAAIETYGVGSGASRLVTGNHPLFAELEMRLARLKGTEACCVFGSGYLANAGIIPTLIGTSDLVLVDELAHACIWAGAQLSRGTVASFRHNDVLHAEMLLSEHRSKHSRALIATDGVFSMDGDLAPLPDLSKLAQHYDAWLLTDDAHGVGVVGGGRGSSFVGEQHTDVPLQMGTLSKAIGGYGAYLCASAAVIDLIRNRARTLIYSTGLPPATVAAAIAAVDLIERDPDYCARPLNKAKAFTRLLGLPEAESPIVPVVIGEEAKALQASRLLEENGFLVVAIRPPTVPVGTARLRITFTAAHPDSEIQRLAETIRDQILGA
ncbi:MAG TPA: 8-amino-7-oxononanoate synthase [Xanthobacteraceae bacterium]|jgi:8-amino-7-oxononanoate synthase|nr:8-amino-7-oxononanoate synthase [Xanthobacteraceae bacterium]